MKRRLIITITAGVLLLTGCVEKQPQTVNLQQVAQSDSLEKVLAQRDNEINDMMGTLNDIQEGFREINEAEGRVDIAKDGEGTNATERIKENIQFISNRMQENRELIRRLQTQFRQSSFKGDQMRRMLESMQQMLDDKDQQLQRLRAELDTKDIHIAELDETINSLNSDVEDLRVESETKTQTINNQDAQLNTAWYVFGTKKELKDQRIIVDGKVLQSSFNKNYFTKIDIRVDKVIKLYSKNTKILTMHPSGSYTLQQDANKQYELRITNPQIFWSTSKYLVVLVR